MASTCGSNREYRRRNKESSSSHFKPTVCLSDWWLIKAEKDVDGKWLAVQGKEAFGEQILVRVFTSAPVAKRHDDFTLATTDGICLILKGFINKPRTIANGFSPDVFKHFLFGFPPIWEQYAKKCFTVADYKNASPIAKPSMQEETPKYKKDKKQSTRKRRASSDKHARSHTPEQTEEVSIVPSDYFKRSRSGRLLLPTLHFWCNQVAVYDEDGSITGVQNGDSVV